ncbi:MAG TPA: asparagine synthase (glutamine-hydrolyzing) [Geminicoccaceae bacterium]|nr:asparagine synthase (glutamine-hydrolyzing) [Geminicoccaceae bacterium]
MCGIAGLITLTGAPAGLPEQATVRRMCETFAYRGPDDSGVEAIGPACLGSRRLSIIDLSAAGHMPMSDPSGRWWITYNGEAYNHAEVRAELERLGHRFRSQTDTEVVLYAYIEWGRAAFDRFVGMFALAILDRLTGELVLVRDRYGVKPLYYSRTRHQLLFSSEIKSLVPHQERLAVDHRSLAEWWFYRNVDALTPETLIEGILAVLPGQMVAIRNAVVTASPWYALASQVSAEAYAAYAAASPAQIVDEIEASLDASVRHRLVSDVPVGTLLSGGLDSSLVTAMAARHGRELTAFHVSIDGFPEYDERPYAKGLADHLGVPLRLLPLDGESFRRELAQVTWLEDLPLTHPNSVAYHLISRVARDAGVTVLLSGEGADELFGGYSWRYRRKRRLLRLQPWLDRLPERFYDLAALAVYAHAGMPVTSHRFREYLPPAVALIDRYSRTDAAEECAEAYGFVADPTDRAVLGGMLADMGDFLAPLLRRLDRTTMGASVECREPFLDCRLVHKAINLPLGYRLGRHADKWILKQVAARYMPRELIHRKKMGFPLPLAEYIAPLADRAFFERGFCEEVLGLGRRGLDRALESWRSNVNGFFGLLGLEIWGRLVFMGEQPELVLTRTQRLERHAAE